MDERIFLMMEQEPLVFVAPEPRRPAWCVHGPLFLLALILLSLCYRLIPDAVLTASGFPDSRILTPLLLLTPGPVLVWMLGAWGYSYWKTNGEYAGRIIPGIILFLIDLALILAVLPPA
jgi:hypothetical protein